MSLDDTDALFADRSVVLFDFDGTIADTAPAITRIARESLLRCGYPHEAEQDLRCLIGPPLFDGFAALCHVPHEESVRITTVYREIFDETVTAADTPVFPGMAELMVRLVEQGRKIAVATSRLEHTAKLLISRLDLPPFDVIVGRLEPGRDTKAECIRDAMAQLGADPRSCVMIGDRHHDIEGAHACGIPCIAVYTGSAPAGEHEAAGADAIGCDVDDIARFLGV